MAERPENHVTKALREMAEASSRSPKLPVLDSEQLKHLEEAYRPRCLRRDENVEDHLRYAGKVELVEHLRASHDARFEETREDSEGDDIDPSNAEPAR